jgi:hypothetical protein
VADDSLLVILEVQRIKPFLHFIEPQQNRPVLTERLPAEPGDPNHPERKKSQGKC